jgi:hypothetical protein
VDVPVIIGDTSDEAFAICECQGPGEGDLHGNCYVDFQDFAILVSNRTLRSLQALPRAGARAAIRTIRPAAASKGGFVEGILRQQRNWKGSMVGYMSGMISG